MNYQRQSVVVQRRLGVATSLWSLILTITDPHARVQHHYMYVVSSIRRHKLENITTAASN